MPFDPIHFAQALDANASSGRSRGRCARYVRLALEAAGFAPFTHPVAAKRYGPTLLNLGFRALPQAGYQPKLGDIAVIQAITGHMYGHIAGWDGRQWVSDFVQLTLYPGAAYRKARPKYVIYRYFA